VKPVPRARQESGVRRAKTLAILSVTLLALLAVVIVGAQRGNPFVSGDPPDRATDAPDNAGEYRLMRLDDQGRWADLPPGASPPERVVLLVHGLDEPGTIFNDLAPALTDAGRTPIYFEYPNDQRIEDSTELLHEALRELRGMGVTRVDLVCHSMGGLVALDCLTRDAMYGGRAGGHTELPSVGDWITVGTPYYGAPMANLRFLSEWRERAVRWAGAVANGASDEPAAPSQSAGEAGADLLPGSEFLEGLNERPLPEGVDWTVIYGEIAGAAGAVGAEVGDGVVPVWSAVHEQARDTVRVTSNHRAMLKSAAIEQAARNAVGADPGVPPGIPVILDRLGNNTTHGRDGS